MTAATFLPALLWIITAVGIGSLASACWIIVQQQEVAVIERFGCFHRMARPGLHFKLPIVERVAGRVSLRVQQATEEVTVLTSDNLFMSLKTNLQYRVLENRVYDAFYKLTDAHQQISSFMLNALRSAATQLTVDALYKDRQAIEGSIRESLGENLANFGFEIVAFLTENPQPSPEVQRSFNRVASARREQEAAEMEGNAHKVKLVKEAEAQAEARRLQGKGIAEQRFEIADGFAAAVRRMSEAVDGKLDEATIISVMTMTNQFDTIREAAHAPGTVVLMPYGGEGSLREIAGMAAALRAKPLEAGVTTPAPADLTKSAA